MTNNLLKDGTRSAKGYKEYKKYSEGGTLSALQAIHAECFCCQSGFFDGKIDCRMTDCPLYPFFVYGKAFKNRPKRVMTEKQKEVIAKTGFKKKIDSAI